jgi:hypothetical protein
MPSIRRVLDRYAGLDQDLQEFNSQWPYHSDLDFIANRSRTLVGEGIDSRSAEELVRLGFVDILEGRYGEELRLSAKGKRYLRDSTEAFSLI